MKKPTVITTITALYRRHPIRFLAVGGAILIAAATITAAVLLAYEPPTPQNATIPAKPRPKPKFYSPLTGREVPDEATTKQAVTAIMIENSPDARPQSGLKGAGVVYEAVAEGGITRFLAIYQEDKPGPIGPVRSLRPYFIDWAAPYHASIAHFGGSKLALDTVRNGQYRDLDMMAIGGGWRVSDRAAPHNVYTDYSSIDRLNQSKGYTSSEFTSFPRATGKPSEAPNATSVSIAISSPLYNTNYVYDAASNTYVRHLGGAPHVDREGGQLQPTVVIALVVSMTKVHEDGWRESIATSGNGRAVVFQNGIATEATWHKADSGSALKITGSDGAEIQLDRGQTWITATPNSGGISWQ